MDLDTAACYQTVLARDARYDGVFFTCVRTTRIYCRPICPAGPPRAYNCTFVTTAAAAQAAGYRPCLRCRPECSPEFSAWQGSSATVARALALIEAGALDEAGVEALAGRVGMGERQLRRLFQHHLGASPIVVAQTRRIHLAKQLIHDTDLPMTQVALASGFGSIRRFNETFQTLYGRGPSELRRRRAHPAAAPDDGISLSLRYRPPYDWDALLAFLATRAVPGVEAVVDGHYRRVVEVAGALGTIDVTHEPSAAALRVTVRFPRLDALPEIIARVRRLFDLGANPTAISAALARDPILAPLVAARPGLRVPGGWDGFEIAVRAILGQQITVRGAVHAAARLARDLGRPLDDAFAMPGLTHAFPGPERFANGYVASGMPRSRAAALTGLAVAAVADPALFHPHRSLEVAIERLCAVPGIGEWTAQYVAMRALRESDAFLAGDIALHRILAVRGVRPTAREVLARSQAWRPWRAYAVLHLWTGEALADAALTA
jgi:AraC family transcriptional regulator of adaptative response / DNA-3-methyladenine glycosylase II